MDYTVHGILPARILKRVAVPFPEDLPDLGIESGSPALQEDSLQLSRRQESPQTGSAFSKPSVFPNAQLNYISQAPFPLSADF